MGTRTHALTAAVMLATALPGRAGITDLPDAIDLGCGNVLCRVCESCGGCDATLGGSGDCEWVTIRGSTRSCSACWVKHSR